MQHVALATSSKYPALTNDDRLLVSSLSMRGLHPEPAVWNDHAQDWSRFSAVIIRSCWDYHLQPEQFLAWIARLESASIPIFNSPSLIRWNADKRYLRDLENKGISIVPTFWPEGNKVPVSLKTKLRELGWERAVLKPRISATAHRTLLVTQDNVQSAQLLFDELCRSPGAMLQKFMSRITAEGEWSVIFFDGKFNHAMIKLPKSGDFRVQNDFGGTTRLTDPPSDVLASATRTVQTVEPTAYARVDGVVDDGEFRLMELELIEPMLFLADHPEAPQRFADAIVRRLNCA